MFTLFSNTLIQHSDPNTHLNPQLDQALVLVRIITPLLLFLTLACTFGSRAFIHFVWKLQNVGYESLPNPTDLHQSTGAHASLPGPHRPSAPVPSTDGIVPVVVSVKKPRRTLVYAINTLILATYFADGILICLRALFEKLWEPRDILAWTGLDLYVASCLLAFVACVTGMAIEERREGIPGAWGQTYTRVFVAEAWFGEIVLGILVIKALSQGQDSFCYSSDPTLNPSMSFY